MVSAAPWEQGAWRIFRLGGTKQMAQGHKAIEDAPGLFIDGHPAFCVQLAQRNMKGPLIMMDLAQAIHGKIDTLADADSGEVDEQQGARRWIRARRYGRVVAPGVDRLREKAAWADRGFAEESPRGESSWAEGDGRCQVPEQAAKRDQILQAGLIA
jgi:hypothetical protein